MIFDRAIHTFSSNPKKLFLLDGFGALLSAFLLGVVLVRFETVFGIPPLALYLLALLPCVFAAYDFYCYWSIKKNAAVFLKIIASVNLLYCLLSLGLAIYHHQSITWVGWSYLIVELLIVITLIFIEFKTAALLNTTQVNNNSLRNKQ